MEPEEETPLLRMPRNFEEALEQLDAKLKDREAWSEYTKAMREYTAACVELVERFADNGFDSLGDADHAAREVLKLKPEEPK